MFRTFIQCAAFLQAVISAFFLIRAGISLSVKDMVELSRTRWNYSLAVLKSLTQQRADIIVGFSLLLLSVVLQSLHWLLPFGIDDLGINRKGVRLAFITAIPIWIVALIISRYLQQKWYKQAENILEADVTEKTKGKTMTENSKWTTAFQCIKKIFQRPLGSRKMDGPDTVRSICEILKAKYPEEKSLEKLDIGEEGSRRLTCFERLFMAFLQIRSVILSLGYWLRRLFISEEYDRGFVEVYVLLRFILLVVALRFHTAFYTPSYLNWFIAITIVWIMSGSFLHPLRTVFVDRYNPRRDGKPWKPHSYNRSLMFLFVSYCEITVGFAYMYVHFGLVAHSDCAKSIINIWDALYFSAVTITTLGYGDMHPISRAGKLLASIEPLMGIVLLIGVVGLIFVEIGRQKMSKTNN